MYCGNCGKPNPDHAVFCQACGAKLYAAVPMPQPAAVNQNAVEAAKPIGRIVLIVLLAILLGGVVWLGVSLFGGRGSADTAKQFWTALYNGNTEELLTLFPDEIYESVEDEEEYERFVHELDSKASYTNNLVNLQLGTEWAFSCKVVEEEKIDSDEKEDILDEYDEMGVRVTDVRDVVVEITFLSEDQEKSGEVTTPVIKVGKSWYLDVLNLSEILY